ncbi:flavin reductase family protein [Rhodovibrionaceae bacterium A322]
MTTMKPPMDRDQFIGAMRQVASSVTVVTTNGPAGRHGATVSAFNSLTADPPSVLICLRAESRIAHAVAKNGRYCVNVLPEDKTEMAGRFAGAQDDQLSDRFDGVALAENSQQDPLACPALDSATAFHCDVDKIIPHGSHLILIGHVTGISEGATPPLAYLDGRFHRVLPH